MSTTFTHDDLELIGGATTLLSACAMIGAGGRTLYHVRSGTISGAAPVIASFASIVFGARILAAGVSE